MTTYIIGHQKPDTDSVVASMAFEFLFNQIDSFGYSNNKASVSHLINPESQFIFNKFNATSPQVISINNIKEEDRVVLVDHNEENQRLENLNNDQIVGIFDHHKLKANFNHPINVVIRNWGSSCTLAWSLIKDHQLKIPQQLAQLMISAILSDTVNFKSSTSTPADELAVNNLNRIAQIENLDKLALEIFKAKSDVSKMSDMEIAKNDFKIYQFGPKKVYISQLETVEQKNILSDRGEALKKVMIKVQSDPKIDLAFLAVTDILGINTKIITTPESNQIGEKAFGSESTSNIIDIGPKLSRKKEIAPAIEQEITK